MTDSGNGYQVETGDIELSDLLLKIAQDKGWRNVPGRLGCQTPWLVIDLAVPDVGWNTEGYDKWPTVSASKFIELLRKGPPQSIRIGGTLVEFQTNGEGEHYGIRVGCQFVDAATIDAIHKRFPQDDKVEDKAEGKHLELRSDPEVEVWLQKSGDTIDLMACGSVPTGNYFLLTFMPDGKVHHCSSIPEEFGFNLTETGTLVIE